MIIIDTREKAPLSFSFYQLATKVAKLDYGDYAIFGLEDKLSIERKASTSELSLNLCTKSGRARFERELVRMEGVERKVLLCEFSQQELLSFPEGSGIPKSKWPGLRISAKYLRKCLNDVVEQYGLELHLCKTREEAEYVAANIIQNTIERYSHDLFPQG